VAERSRQWTHEEDRRDADWWFTARVRPGGHPKTGRHRDFPWSGPLQQEIVLKSHQGSSEFTIVATITRDTQLDLLQYVIETQRLVNAVPAQAGDRALGILLDRVQTVTNADGAAIELAERNFMVQRAVSGLSTDREGSRSEMDGGFSGLCLRIGMPLLCRDADTDPRVDNETCRRAGIRSIAVAPMVRAAEPIGVLRIMSSEAEHSDKADAEVLELMANLITPGLSHTSKMEREAERALRDPLTGLANRWIFMDRLAHHGYEARRYGRPYGLFLIGLDRFTVVNETLGQEWGDAVLRSVAQGLNATVRGGDTLARLEGDQFVVLCGNAEQSVVEERLKGRIDGVVAAVDKDLSLDGYTLTASVGVVWSPGSDATVDELLTAARTSLIRAKAQRYANNDH
jgi:diguanylate cyclase